jgi:3-phosphoshikimate 1-carboxyvinyltransferase
MHPADPAPPPRPQPWPAPTATGPVGGTVRLPGSKSMTARALVLAALADGPSTLHGPLHARDTDLMTAGLRALGGYVSTLDPRRWVVRPQQMGGPAHVDVGLSGTVARFLLAVAGLARGEVTFDGDRAMRQRPLRPLVEALRSAGVEITVGEAGGLPLTVAGTGAVTGGEVTLDASASSQFVSGLLLAGPRFQRGVVVRHVGGARIPSRPHLQMTVDMLRAAGAAVYDRTPHEWSVQRGRLAGRAWQIEPDLSSAAPFLAAALVTGGEVTVPAWPPNTSQPGHQLRTLLEGMGATCTLSPHGLTVRGTGRIHGIEADLSDVSELTPVLAAVCALAESPSRLWGVSHIRGHETDRLTALADELGGLGAKVATDPDGLSVQPRPMRGGEFRTYADHRMAHAGAVLGLVVPGIVLTDVGCTAKTLPEFPALWERIIG